VSDASRAPRHSDRYYQFYNYWNDEAYCDPRMATGLLYTYAVSSDQILGS